MRASRLAAALAVIMLAPALPASAQDATEIDPPRLRFGVDVGGGLSWDADANTGGAMQTGVRTGVQIDHAFALYYVGRIAAAGIETEPRRAVWLVTTSNGVGFDVTLLRTVQVGAALALDYLAGDSCGGSLCFRAEEGWYVGIDVRVALVAFAFHDRTTGRRNGFLVSALWHTTPLPDQPAGVGALHSLALNLGWEVF